MMYADVIYPADYTAFLVGYETSVSDTYTGLDVTVRDRGCQVAKFFMAPLPGCCGIVVSFGTRVDDREKGLGTQLQALKERLAQDMGFTVMIATDVLDNVPQMKIFKKTGWTELMQFENGRTGNDVGIFAKGVWRE